MILVNYLKQQSKCKLTCKNHWSKSIKYRTTWSFSYNIQWRTYIAVSGHFGNSILDQFCVQISTEQCRAVRSQSEFGCTFPITSITISCYRPFLYIMFIKLHKVFEIIMQKHKVILLSINCFIFFCEFLNSIPNDIKTIKKHVSKGSIIFWYNFIFSAKSSGNTKAKVWASHLLSIMPSDVEYNKVWLYTQVVFGYMTSNSSECWAIMTVCAQKKHTSMQVAGHDEHFTVSQNLSLLKHRRI